MLDGEKGEQRKIRGGKVAYRRNKAGYINTFIGLFVIFGGEPHQTDCDVQCIRTLCSHIDYTHSEYRDHYFTTGLLFSFFLSFVE